MSILKRKIRLIPSPSDIESDDEYFQVKPEYIHVQKPFDTLDFSAMTPTSTRAGSKQLSEEAKSETRIEPGNLSAAKGTKIVRNYAKALCSFAASDMAIPYLKDMISKDFQGKADIAGFQKHMKDQKGKTASISSLRGLLMINKNDTEREKAYKQMFSQISILFLKFFAVNWIFSGKVKYRLEHLKYRQKMLRRVRNPEFFTYLKSSSH